MLYTNAQLDAQISRLRAAKFVAPPADAPMAHHFITWSGWDVFSTEDDCDSRGGKAKVSYFAVHQDTGEQREIDISPYGYGDMRLIRRIVDLGFPKRLTCAPLTHEDCDQIAAYRRAAE